MWTPEQAKDQIKELAELKVQQPGGMTFPRATFDQLDRAFRAAAQLHRLSQHQEDKYGMYTWGVWIAATYNALKNKRAALYKSQAHADPDQ